MDNRVICGVLGGLAEYLDTDANLVRFIYLLLIFFYNDIAGLLIALYIIACIFIPEKAGKTRIYNSKLEEEYLEKDKVINGILVIFAILIILYGISILSSLFSYSILFNILPLAEWFHTFYLKFISFMGVYGYIIMKLSLGLLLIIIGIFILIIIKRSKGG